jgi:hypothetical protein
MRKLRFRDRIALAHCAVMLTYTYNLTRPLHSLQTVSLREYDDLCSAYSRGLKKVTWSWEAVERVFL